ncbi:class III lanthionine synthetase LanKC [Nocardiopsis terrae]
MSAHSALYTLAHSSFFESPTHWEYEESEFALAAKSAPAGWSKAVTDVWQHFAPSGSTLPDQGWKVHVSATTGNAEEVLNIVYNFCLSEKVAFKFLRTRRLVESLSMKYAPRSASGKFIAIYPVGDEKLLKTLTALGERLREFEGPYILSDVRWGTSPVFFRYGGFTLKWSWTPEGNRVPALNAPDGTLVPDSRKPGARPPSWVTPPDFLRPHLTSRDTGEGEFPYKVSQALHFSNAGGVYLAASAAGGASVALKEARPYAGVDRDGRDARARLSWEGEVLKSVGDLPGFPGNLGGFRFWEHEFLVMEHMRGETLQTWLVRNHPLLNWRDSPSARVEYVQRAETLWLRVRERVEELHARGFVFGDLHPANILVDDAENVSLVDFEAASRAGEAEAQLMGYPGFLSRSARGTGIDGYALAVLRLWLFLPVVTVLDVAPDKAESLVSEAIRLFDLPPDFSDTVRAAFRSSEDRPEHRAGERVTTHPRTSIPVEGAGWDGVRTSLCSAIQASATPDRTDRLFPGHFRQFNAEPGCFAYDAAGVLWAQSVTGHAPDPEHVQWLVDRANEPTDRPGFYDGAHGIAFALDHLGHRSTAEQVIDRCTGDVDEMTDVTLFSGLAGIGLNLFHLSGGEPDHPHVKRAREIAARVSEQLTTAERAEVGHHRLPDSPCGPTGLFRGWSGPALLLLRLHQVTGESEYLRQALRALYLDLDNCSTTLDGTLQAGTGGVLRPYLESGSAGIALVVREVLRHIDDHRLSEALPFLVRACRSPLVVDAPLFNGRAGLIAVSHEFRDGFGATDVVREHLSHLHWHALSYDGHLAFPGDGGVRLSMDLASGNAGVLLALSYVRGMNHHPLLPFLGTPRAPGPFRVSEP